jgi:hypothetical protein
MTKAIGQRNRRIALLASVLLGSVPAMAQDVPTREFTCVKTRIARLEHRLQNGANGPFVPDSGSAVRYANGLYQVSYNELDAVHQSRSGDPVFICLVRIPQACPPGDSRGRVYTATNLRTLGSWTMPDSEHACGGA